MANWWEAAPVVQQAPQQRNWWEDAPVVAPDTQPPNLPPPGATEDRSYTGSILPFSRDASGDLSFDSNAGLLGVAKRAFGLPGEVYRGEVDPLSNEGIGRAVEMATAVSPASAAARAGEAAIPGAVRALQPGQTRAPTADELRAAAKAGYDAVRDSGVDYRADAVRDMALSARQALEADGIIDTLAPKTFSVLNRLTEPPTGSVAPISGLEAARRGFGKAGRDFQNPTDQEAARRAKAAIDSFIEAADPQTILAGAAPDTATVLRQARANSAAGKRSDSLQGVERHAELRAAVANSGQNADNSTRQRLASLLLNPKAIAGFNGPERAAIEQVARGSRSANSARAVGNFLGGGGGMGAFQAFAAGVGGGGYLAGGPGAVAGAVAPLVGVGAKSLGALLTRQGLRSVDEATRARSPLFNDRLASTPAEAVSAERRFALARALLMTAPASQGD